MEALRAVIEPFDQKSDWSAYCERIDLAFKVCKVAEDDKVSIFLLLIGKSSYSSLRKLCYPKLPETKPLIELQELLSDKYSYTRPIFSSHSSSHGNRPLGASVSAEDTVNTASGRAEQKSSAMTKLKGVVASAGAKFKKHHHGKAALKREATATARDLAQKEGDDDSAQEVGNEEADGKNYEEEEIHSEKGTGDEQNHGAGNEQHENDEGRCDENDEGNGGNDDTEEAEKGGNDDDSTQDGAEGKQADGPGETSDAEAQKDAADANGDTEHNDSQQHPDHTSNDEADGDHGDNEAEVNGQCEENGDRGSGDVGNESTDQGEEQHSEKEELGFDNGTRDGADHQEGDSDNDLGQLGQTEGSENEKSIDEEDDQASGDQGSDAEEQSSEDNQASEGEGNDTRSNERAASQAAGGRALISKAGKQRTQRAKNASSSVKDKVGGDDKQPKPASVSGGVRPTPASRKVAEPKRRSKDSHAGSASGNRSAASEMSSKPRGQ